jgi:TonB-linked SusC/RagA family outer membrane protein
MNRKAAYKEPSFSFRARNQSYFLNSTMKKTLLLCAILIYTQWSVALADRITLLDRIITGTVHDSNGESLPGVSVVVSGTTKGTITNESGSFSISVPDNATTLTFSFVGFKTMVVNIGTQSNIHVVLLDDVSLLGDIVITGYGQTQNKRLVSTAISTIDPKKMIQDRPIARLEQAIQGATPAVVVMQESGSPGAPLTTRMRGAGTAGNSNPLVLLDGFQIPDMSFINANDIGGIGIYKDAASSAIYGSRAGNGVLNVQSRSASSDKKLNVSFSSYAGMQSLAREGDYLTSKQYGSYYNASYNYLIRQGISTVGKGRVPFTDDELDALPNTSWISAVSDNAPIQDYHLGLSGKIGETKYYLGGGIFDQGGIIGSTNFTRKTLNLNVNTPIGKRINMSVLGMYTNNIRDFIAENSENSRLLSSVASLPAIFPLYAESGSPLNTGLQGGIVVNGVPINSIAEFGNPLLGLTHGENISNANILLGNVLLNAELSKGLKFNTSFGALTRKNAIRNFGQSFAYPDQQYQNLINGLSENNVDEKYLQWEGYLSFDREYQGHTISAVLGTSLLQNQLQSTGRSGRDFSKNRLDEVSFADIADPSSIVIFKPYEEINTTASYYGRVNYNYKEKYLFGATMRMDGSSKFGPENKWGAFPSVSAGWLLSSEEFMKNVSYVEQLKVRASWGINGNDRIPPYQYYDRYSINGSGNYIKQDYNTSIKWEEITQTNVGLDIDLFGNKVGITLDYYIKETEDMLVPFPNPAFTGLPAPVRNTATVSNQGFEAMVMYTTRVSDDFKFDISANIGTNRNKLTSLNGGLPLYGAATRVFNGAPYLTRSEVGDPIASFYGYKFTGLDNAGNPVYKDISGPDGIPDGVISAEYDRTTIGNPFPDFIYGFNISMKYKGFDLTTFINGTHGNDVVNASTGYGFQYSNRTTRVLDAWSSENPTSKVMRPSALEVVNHDFSNYYIEDGSYTRLKNITLGYEFAESFLEKVKLEQLRVYVSANNLFTRTKYSGYDPEIGANNDPRDVGVDRGFYPQAKSVIVGLRLSF